MVSASIVNEEQDDPMGGAAGIVFGVLLAMPFWAAVAFFFLH